MRETFNQFHRLTKLRESYIKFSFHTILKSCFIELKVSEGGVFANDTLMKDLYISAHTATFRLTFPNTRTSTKRELGIFNM